MDIHERITELLEKRGWSLYKLAKESGIYETTVYDWFNEKHFTPSAQSIEYICAALNISQAEFYSGIDETNLSDEQLRLLELFAKVPAKKHKVVFDLLKALSDTDDRI